MCKDANDKQQSDADEIVIDTSEHRAHRNHCKDFRSINSFNPQWPEVSRMHCFPNSYYLTTNDFSLFYKMPPPQMSSFQQTFNVVGSVLDIRFNSFICRPKGSFALRAQSPSAYSYFLNLAHDRSVPALRIPKWMHQSHSTLYKVQCHQLFSGSPPIQIIGDMIYTWL